MLREQATTNKSKPFAGCDYCGKEPEGAEYYWRYDHKSQSWMAACTVCYPKSNNNKEGDKWVIDR